MQLTLTAADGAALATAPGSTSGTANVYKIPPGSTIVITPQRGFGSVVQTGTDEDLATATADVNTVLAGYGVS
jgi:hypothetical protein